MAQKVSFSVGMSSDDGAPSRAIHNDNLLLLDPASVKSAVNVFCADLGIDCDADVSDPSSDPRVFSRIVQSLVNDKSRASWPESLATEMIL